ncbi:MAG: acyl-ACP--UDP-N-acetylglucosamine O-acyltransferase [Bdellovibrionaceae bacterium]|nr:acyl-ACP--UDP-N-acetylglucosamine O-acyltransferase [Bdellovibrionales bacterium]MCB9085895.1 acyl-ACP--UDP-N-acetylglucosamine O-acyltransferase [Pseudobdellovibrionaceae bacterium]
MSIHPTAILSDKTEVADGVKIGPYVVTRGRVKIGKGTVIDNHVTIGTDSGIVEIGENNHFLAGAVVGSPPQDLTYRGEATKLILGDRNTVREYCTLNLGTAKGGGVTRIGDDCLLMAYVHVAHDCHIKNKVVIANSAQFAGHVTVEDHVKIGGGCLFSQFITLGEYCYIAGDTAVNKDIIPYCIAYGNFATIRATNKIGLERAGFSKDEVENIHRAIRLVIKGGHTLGEALVKIEETCTPSDHIKRILDFIHKSERGIAR